MLELVPPWDALQEKTVEVVPSWVERPSGRWRRVEIGSGWKVVEQLLVHTNMQGAPPHLSPSRSRNQESKGIRSLGLLGLDLRSCRLTALVWQGNVKILNHLLVPLRWLADVVSGHWRSVNQEF